MNDTNVLEVQADTAYEAAQRLVGEGTSVIPIGKEKRPSIATWKPFQERLATSAELKTWFAKGQNGLAIVAGVVSGNIEVLDFDDPTTMEPWDAMVNALAPGLIERLVIVETPKGGRHLYYRCGTIEGNQKLAVSAARETMIETRGEGWVRVDSPKPRLVSPTA
jgi:Bifunctional DNA primase/polymerase, N-terminal